MTKGIKIVTIGGGSSYTPELVEGIIKRYEELPVRELWLVDIPEGEKKLNIVGTLAKRMVEKAGVPIEIHLTLDRREALKDADFVTTQFRVGLLEARAKDERIPLKYGVIGQETNGPGGLFKGLRTHHQKRHVCFFSAGFILDQFCLIMMSFGQFPCGFLKLFFRHGSVPPLCGGNGFH